MDDPGFDDTYFQSTNSDNQHLFAQSMAKLVLEFRYEILQKFYIHTSTALPVFILNY